MRDENWMLHLTADETAGNLICRYIITSRKFRLQFGG